MSPLRHVIRAAYSDRSVRVYQAFPPEIALPALKAGRFVPPFSMNRMTWIKPSFNWMMYRSGYASKPGQQFVLALDITREGFEWALRHATLSSYQPGFHPSPDAWKRDVALKPVRVQWDPERDWRLHPIKDIRAIQIGLSHAAVHHYVHQWILHIEDLTPVARALAAAANSDASSPPWLPSLAERHYPLDPAIEAAIGA